MTPLDLAARKALEARNGNGDAEADTFIAWSGMVAPQAIQVIEALMEALEEVDQPGMASQEECDRWAAKRDAALARVTR